jgi:NAD(P)-dependent dehydrogenase (short-subunit alcohol dehydrogenase family)
MTLAGKTILVTGAARRVGQYLAISLAEAGADVIIHHANSPELASHTVEVIEQLGRRAWVLAADFSDPQAVEGFIEKANRLSPLSAVVNNAAIFEPLSLSQTSLADWQRHLNINLTVPFLLCRDFANSLPEGRQGRIVNVLDWRALRPAGDHFPYTVSKAALAAMTQSLAVALAPRITVNGLALGAILPPSDGGDTSWVKKQVPAARWARLEEVAESLLFLLDGPDYITGEILYLDGGRHLI